MPKGFRKEKQGQRGCKETDWGKRFRRNKLGEIEVENDRKYL